jgi:fatty-acyl-CoA synthase
VTIWNFGDLLQGVERVLPGEAPALIHGDATVSWEQYARRSWNLIRALHERGAKPGDKVAFYMRNSTAYSEVLGACFKARWVHVNVNYRYLDDELHYIFDDSDARFVFFDAEFAGRVEGLVSRSPKVAHWIQVGERSDSDAATAAFAEAYEDLAGSGSGEPLEIARSSDDLIFIYTGGTTGMPKGVMWRHEDLWGALGHGATVRANPGRVGSPEEHVRNVGAHGPGPRQISACPLMHGTGLLTAIGNFTGGGCTVTLAGANFAAEELFDTVDRVQANSAVIVGDAFARPMLAALDANPGRWDLSSFRVIVSSGVMWSREVKLGLLRHLPQVVLADMFGSSEAVGFGSSLTSGKGESRTATFKIGDGCRVFTEDHREVEPGSGERGFIARTGPIPLGYYKDREKTAKTFPTIDGVRYSIPGDWCTVDADGTLNLLGRGSACINTAGEKVYPEEVEEALKTHDDVFDALVFGVADPKWGQAVTGVVELRPGAELDERALRDHVRASLAGYKTPKCLLAVDQMFRAPNGKADYKRAASWAASRLELEADPPSRNA